jgi:hypothetical protein
MLLRMLTDKSAIWAFQNEVVVEIQLVWDVDQNVVLVD